MKTMKRLLTLFLALTVVLAMAMPVFTVRVEAAEISGDWEYTLNSGVATITRYNGTDSVVTVPKMFGNYLVNTIGERAFENNGVVQKVILHDKIITIGNYAFSGCVNLRSIEIPESVVYLGTRAFGGCVNVNTITIHARQLADYGKGTKPFYGVGQATDGVTVTFAEGCTTVPAYLFYCYDDVASKANITNVVMTDSVTSVKDNAFNNCDSIQSIAFSNELIRIGNNAFSGCVGLKSLEIPESTVYLGEKAFKNCVNVKTITIYAKQLADYGKSAKPFYGVGQATDGVTVTFAEGCTTVPAYMFYCYDIVASKANIKTVVMADSVTKINGHAFDACDSIQSVAFSNELVSIGEHAFWGCVGLKSLEIPESTVYLGESAFKKCTNIETITIYAKQLADYGKKTKPFYGVGQATDGVTVTFAEGCTTVPAYMFYCYDDIASKANIKTVVMADSVTNINRYAFDACDSIETVSISKNIQKIGEYAFSVCTGLERVDFMGNAPVINKTAFTNVTTNCYYRLGYNWTRSFCQNYGGALTWNCIHPTPSKPHEITNVVSGIHVYWSNVPGVAKYGLWRSETGKNGTYKWVANPTVPHFTDTKVESGKTYYYKVTTMDANGKHSEKSDAIGITYVSTPDISARYNKAAGVKLDWKKVPGATGYAIYRKSYSGSDAWVRVATISGNSTFTWTDTSVKNNNGTAYKYTIRALTGSDMKTLSGCRNAGRSMVRLTSRTLSSATKASATSIKCSWNTSAAVTGYEVRFIVDGVVYKTVTVGDYKVGVKTFTGLKAGQTYKIQVRSYKKIDGMGFYSAWSTAKNVTL